MSISLISKNAQKVLLNKNLRLQGSKYIGDYKFDCKNEVPVFEISTIHALNQIIGHAKFNNNNYGTIYYRGERRLHDSIIPSLYREGTHVYVKNAGINKLLKEIRNQEKKHDNFKLSGNVEFDNYKLEGCLQHYGISTRFIDVVDNHWVALWMGLNTPQKLGKKHGYIRYTPREIPFIKTMKGQVINEENLYQYILLIAIPNSREHNTHIGITRTEKFVSIDLRQALPSVFLRPHAQHGIVVRKRCDSNCAADFDIATEVIGILKIRIDYATEWLGDGLLLSQDNLFPPAAFDQGLEILSSWENGKEIVSPYFVLPKYV